MVSKITIYIFFFLSFLLNSIQGNAQKIHSFCIIDTDMQASDLSFPTELRDGAMYIRTQLTKEAKFLARNLNLTEADINYYEVSGEAGEGKNNFSSVGLREELDVLEQQFHEGDIVLLATYSHGIQGNSNNNSPFILLGRLDTPNPDYFGFESVLSHIMRLKPSICVSVVSACQVPLNAEVADVSYYRPQMQRVWTASGSKSRNDSQYQYELLFKKPSGTIYPMTFIELYSCSKAQLTYVDSEGGIFAKSFFESFARHLSGGGRKQIDWQTIVQEVQREVVQNTINNEGGVQVPFGSMKCFDADGNRRINKKLTLDNIVPDTTPIRLLEIDITKGRPSPSLDLLIRFIGLGHSYRDLGAKKQALQTVDTTIHFLKKMVEKNDRNGNKPSSKKINAAGNSIYHLAKAYELKAVILEDEGRVEAEFLQEEALKLYERLGAKSSIEVMKIKEQKKDVKKVEKP